MEESDTSKDVTIAVLKERVKTLEEHLERTDKQIESLMADRDRALKWGIMVLGTAVMSMASWIFSAVTKGH